MASHLSSPSHATDTGRSAQELSELLHLVYAAAADEHLWPGVLQAVATSLRGRTGVLFTPYLPPQEKGMYHALNITPEQSMLWATKYLALDLWTNRAFERGLVTQGAVITDADTATEEEFRASVIYQDLFSTMDVGRFCSGVIFDNSTDGIPATVVTTHRSFSAPAFSQQDRNWLGLLLPHLSRSLGLMYTIHRAQLLQGSMLSALDGLPLGVMLLNADGQLVHANTAAKLVLARQDGLACSPSGQLVALPLRAGQPHLADWLRAQTHLATPDVLHFADAFLARRSLAGQVYSVQCCPVGSQQVWHIKGQQAVACVVFVSNPEALILPTPDRLKGLYGLTLAEAKVTHALARGMSNKEAAKALGTAPDTVRTQVKSVYQKMRVSSQSDLVRLIMTLGQASI